ncbi:MAG: signal peptidase I [Aeromicrobium sp.]|uniref:signal peptidase I n=1 Tax=Aeromicrobium sp. TaxID=1871063 RepID=UPI003C6A6F9B
MVGSLLWIGAVLGAASAVLAVLAASGHLRPLVFTSGSMEPTIPTGALAFSRPVAATDIVVGDVVSVTRGDGARVTHRVVSTTMRSDGVVMTLQGDANPSPDVESYRADAAYRVVFGVPWIGHIVTAIAVPWIRALLVMMVAGTIMMAPLLRPQGQHCSPASAQRRAPGRRRQGVPLVVSAVLIASVVIPQTAVLTKASFTDTSLVSSGSVASGGVTKPVAVSCTTDNPLLGTKSLTTTWQASAVPTALAYTAVIRETGQSLTVTASGSQRSARVTADLLGTLVGSNFNIDVTATLPNTSWTAGSTRAGTLNLLGTGFTCGAWS